MSKRKFVVKQKSREGWILYLMVHFPFLIFWKIGITGRTATARARDIDEAVFGFPIPVFVVVVPGAYYFEQMLHNLCRPLQVRFYTGDGASEWFMFLAVIPALGFMLTVWGVYAWLISQATTWDALAWYLDTLSVMGGWIIHAFNNFAQ